VLRLLYVLSFLAAAGSWWFSVMDRRSVAAMYVVEWETAIGLPLWSATLALGAALLVAAELPRLVAALGNPRRRVLPREPRKAPEAPRIPLDDAPGGFDWLDDAVARAQALAWEPQARLRISPKGPVPFTLVLRHATPEQVRRAVSDLGRFLTTIPLPRRTRIDFESCMMPRHLRQAEVTGALKLHLSPESFRTVAAEDGVDLLFTRSDPRWSG
jgi:hypothetical protein